MHRRDNIRTIIVAAALVTSAAVFAAVLVAAGAAPSMVIATVAFILVGWAAAAAMGRLFSSRLVPLDAQVPPVDLAEMRTVHEPRLNTSDGGYPSLHAPTPDAAPDQAPAIDFSLARPSTEMAVPKSVGPADVVQALAVAGSYVGDVFSAGLWLEDEPTATLRLIAGAGRIPPGDTPIATDDASYADAVDRHVPVWTELAEVTERDRSARLWRFVQPVQAGDARGVATLDVFPSGAVSLPRVVDETRHLRSSLAGAIALHVAELETRTARELIAGARELSRCLDPDAVLECALRRAAEMSSAETGSVMMADDDGVMTIVYSIGLPQDVVDGTRVTPGEGISGWVLQSGQPLLVEDLPPGAGTSSRRGVRSAVSVPIGDEEGIIGVLNVGSRAFPARFTRTHMDAVEVLGRQACVAYRNALALGAARELYLSTLRTLAVAMETKDPYSRGATQRVLDLVADLGDRMELDDDTKTSLEVAALFHDLGMSAVGEGVLRHDRPLSTVELGLLKMHPSIAADVLAEAPALAEVAPIVYHHHERYDGQGYVGGLAGDAIPIGARTLAVVDAFVAMTSKRPYRSAMTDAEAVAELKDNAGTQFDPDVVDTFVRMLGQGERRTTERQS